jgi:hypothetical protein
MSSWISICCQQPQNWWRTIMILFLYRLCSNRLMVLQKMNFQYFQETWNTCWWQSYPYAATEQRRFFHYYLITIPISSIESYRLAVCCRCCIITLLIIMSLNSGYFIIKHRQKTTQLSLHSSQILLHKIIYNV